MTVLKRRVAQQSTQKPPWAPVGPAGTYAVPMSAISVQPGQTELVGGPVHTIYAADNGAEIPVQGGTGAQLNAAGRP
jgi:hypothetical protein